MKFLLNLLFPNKCIICDNYSSSYELCNECWSNCSFITKPYCFICSHPFAYETDPKAICGACVATKPKYDRAIALLKYDHHSKKIIHKFKYQDQLHILNYLTNLMLNMGKELIEQSDIIIPVPMHKYKLLKRGYNQAALLAMNLAKITKLKYLPQALTKLENSTPQAGLKKEERAKNIKHSFELNEKFTADLKGKNILLIDDVITTGATISECTKILKKAKPSKVYVLAVAKRV